MPISRPLLNWFERALFGCSGIVNSRKNITHMEIGIGVGFGKPQSNHVINILGKD